LCLTVVFWRHCFESEDYLQGENSWSGLNWLCLARFFLKTLLLTNWTSGVVLVVVVWLLQEL